MIRLCFLTLVLQYVIAVPPIDDVDGLNKLREEVGSLKYSTKVLAVQLEKWNNFFLTSLEPRVASSASLLASIDSNINNLQERAHVWDTFQLHVAAWNDQLAILDRKMDIISNGLGKLIALDTKIDTVFNLDYKIDSIIKKIENVDNTISNLSIQKHNVNHEGLFGEFAARGILSTVKMVEKKLDRLLLSQQNSQITRNPGEKGRISIKCNTPRVVEELVKDISSKVDIIFDRISADRENENDYELEEFEGSGVSDETPLKMTQDKRVTNKMVKRMIQPCDQLYQTMKQVLNTSLTIENNSWIILNKQATSLEKLLQSGSNSSKLLTAISERIDKKVEESNVKLNLLKNQLEQQQTYVKRFLTQHLSSSHENSSRNCAGASVKKVVDTKSREIFPIRPLTPATRKDTTSFERVTDGEKFIEPLKNFCEDLETDAPSGIYLLGKNEKTNSKGRRYNERYCLIRDDGLWTVIQRRDNYTVLQNFNQSWDEYAKGFGSLNRDFWFGNEFIFQLSQTKVELVLRIELADFEGNHVWAEYDIFKMFSVHDNYRIYVEGYRGNASDSFSSHNITQFSTFDAKNDEAPKCCPCAETYGGGWWFNKCFESNLNGVYYREPRSNGYFRGIIWESWLENYSLKYTTMMVKAKEKGYVSRFYNEEP